MFVINHKAFFLWFSGVLVAASWALVLFYGLNLGVDFKGGSLVEVSYPHGRPALESVNERVSALGLGAFTVQPVGADSFLVRTQTLSESKRAPLLDALSLSNASNIVEKRFTTVGPAVGQELKNKALAAIALVVIAIVVFIAFAFRKVSKPLPSWKYGLVVVVALLHDVTLPVGVFALLGHARGVEVDILVVTALLAILGYSVNDTIVVFDRIRENLRRKEENNRREPFEETVGRSLAETYGRSINTSLTVLLAVLALLFFGAESTRYFSLVLLVGVIAGTYSSIFIASPILVILEKRQK